MKFPDRPLCVNLCNNNKVLDYFFIFGKRKGHKRSYQYCNHLPTNTTSQWREICVPTKTDNLQVYFRKVMRSSSGKEEAGTVQREEKEVSTAASHNLAKIYLQIVIFSRHTYFSPLTCSISWQVITILI